jgi:hypothetical protein
MPRLEGGVLLAQGEELLEDRDEAAVVRALHVATRAALALLDDADERGLRARQVRHRDQPGPGQRGRAGLCPRGADEQQLGAQAGVQVLESFIERPVQLAL